MYWSLFIGCLLLFILSKNYSKMPITSLQLEEKLKEQLKTTHLVSSHVCNEK